MTRAGGEDAAARIDIRSDPEVPAAGFRPSLPPVRVDGGSAALLTGPRGCGKSTVLRVAVGLGRPAGLRARLGGLELGRLSHRARRRALAGLRLFYLPRDPVLISNLSVLENLLLPIRFHRERPEAEAAGEARGRLEEAGLPGLADAAPARLSREARRMVVLVRGFLRRPAVALLDDPLAGLEERRRDTVLRWMAAARDGWGCALLATSRDADPYAALGSTPVAMGPAPAEDR